MDRTEVSVIISEAGVRGDTQAANQRRGAVRLDVPVLVGHDHHVKLVRIDNKLLGKIIDNQLLERKFRISGNRLFGNTAEKLVRLGQHVIFGSYRHLPFAAGGLPLHRQSTRGLADGPGGRLGGKLDGEFAFGSGIQVNIEHGVMQIERSQAFNVPFKSGIKAFQVLADDVKINAFRVFKRAFQTGDIPGGTEIGIAAFPPP